MKRLVAILVLAALAVSASAAPLSERQSKFLRRRFVEREERVQREDGNILVIRHFKRGGKPDGAETNVLHRITGVIQNNALRNQLEKMRTDLVSRIEDLRAATNRLSVLEANKRAVIAELERKRDAAALSTTKAVYQAIIDRINGDVR